MLAWNPDYKALFPSLLRRHVGTDGRYPGLRSLDEIIKWAKRNLRKEDKIVWFLRWVRLYVAEGVDQEFQRRAPGEEEYFARLVNKYVKQLLRRDPSSYRGLVSPRSYIGHVTLDALMMQLSHFMALNLQAIADYEFGWKNPIIVLRELGEIEETAERRVGIPVDEANDYDVLMDFGDGYVWFDTRQRAVSDQTHATTGHCSRCDQADQTALVLREYVEDPDLGAFWRPVLQFCIDPQGYLGEMKGAANSRPKEAYHKYIIPLLEHNYVKGIVGEGYKPWSNFSVLDLPQEITERLLVKKPDLLTIDEQAERGQKVLRQLALVTDRPRTRRIGSSENLTSIELMAQSPSEYIEEFGTAQAKGWIHTIEEGCVGIDYIPPDRDLEDVVDDLPEALRRRVADWQEDDDLRDVVQSAFIRAQGDTTLYVAERALAANFKEPVGVSCVVASDTTWEGCPGHESLHIYLNAWFDDAPIYFDTNAYTVRLLVDGTEFLTEVEKAAQENMGFRHQDGSFIRSKPNYCRNGFHFGRGYLNIEEVEFEENLDAPSDDVYEWRSSSPSSDELFAEAVQDYLDDFIGDEDDA